MKPSIVFSHGIWADGSSFQKLIPALREEGHQVMAAQYGLDTVKGDVEATIRSFGRVIGPIVLVGHSYGGTVITHAGTDCLSGTVLDEPLERFTISDIRAVDEALLQELQRWPSFRRTAEGDQFGDFANHCATCGDVTLVPLARTIRLSGNEHFVIE